MVYELLNRISGYFKLRQSIVVVHTGGSESDVSDTLVPLIKSGFPAIDYEVEAVFINPENILHDAEKISAINPPTIVFQIEVPFSQDTISNYMIQMRQVMAASKNFVFAFVYNSNVIHQRQLVALRQIASGLSEQIAGTPAKVISVDLANNAFEDDQRETLGEVTRAVMPSKVLRERFGVERHLITAISLFGNMRTFMLGGSIAGAAILGIVAFFAGAELFVTLLLAACGVMLGCCIGFMAGFVAGACQALAGRFDSINSLPDDSYAKGEEGAAIQLIERTVKQPEEENNSQRFVQAAVSLPVVRHPANLYDGGRGARTTVAMAAGYQQQAAPIVGYRPDGPPQ